jgi:hypothetical protein
VSDRRTTDYSSAYFRDQESRRNPSAREANPGALLLKGRAIRVPIRLGLQPGSEGKALGLHLTMRLPNLSLVAAPQGPQIQQVVHCLLSEPESSSYRGDAPARRRRKSGLDRHEPCRPETGSDQPRFSRNETPHPPDDGISRAVLSCARAASIPMRSMSLRRAVFHCGRLMANSSIVSGRSRRCLSEEPVWT